ncbi:MAG: EI24 domain-containing protein [Rhodospirillaceae bacterium]|nr:EI24 domain-containing protein [Rhodospirillaceae bacterium]
MIVRAVIEGFLDLKNPRLWVLVAKCAALTLAVYAALFAALVWLLRNSQVSELPWLETLADWGAGTLAAVLATLVFPGVVSAVLSVFLDDVVRLVEADRYADRGPGRDVPVTEAVSSAVGLAAWTVGLNLVFLPLYLVLFFIPPLNLVVYYLLNGRLLGREYFETVALRRVDAAAMAALRRQHAGTIWLAGAATAALLTVPIVNLVAAVVGVAAMVHIFHKLTGRA